MIKIILTLTLIMGAGAIGSSIVLAQSQPNYGPNGPAKSDCFGEPFSGTAAAKCTPRHWRR
jgi:hypothetical protein